jgi:hypothetical protein
MFALLRLVLSQKGRSSAKKRTPFRWAENYLSLNPPGYGFQILETPEQLGPFARIATATQLLGHYLGRRAYYAWKREGPSYALEEGMKDHQP